MFLPRTVHRLYMAQTERNWNSSNVLRKQTFTDVDELFRCLKRVHQRLQVHKYMKTMVDKWTAGPSEAPEEAPSLSLESLGLWCINRTSKTLPHVILEKLHLNAPLKAAADDQLSVRRTHLLFAWLSWNDPSLAWAPDPEKISKHLQHTVRHTRLIMWAEHKLYVSWTSLSTRRCNATTELSVSGPEAPDSTFYSLLLLILNKVKRWEKQTNTQTLKATEPSWVNDGAVE